MNQMSRHFLLAAAAMACMHAQGVFAQSVPSRAGLWVEASEAKINGNAAPTMLDIDGAMDEQTRSGIKQAMRKYGLPAGWNPSLSCITAQELNVQQWIKKTSKNCGNLSTKQSGDKVTFSGTCAMGGQTATVKGSAQFNGDKEVVHEARVEGTYQGKPVVSETRSVSKWVGADCNNPPAGIDPAWLGEMAAANP